MSQILRDLNKLAEKMGAPVVGQNISEQVRAISTFYGGTSHGANINERINEVRQAYHGGGSEPVLVEKSITENGTYLASDDSADGYSKVTVSTPVEDLSMPNGFYRISQYGEYYTTALEGVDWRNPWEIGICVRKLTSTMLSNGTAFGDAGDYWRSPKSLITDTEINLVTPVNLSADTDVLSITTEGTFFPQLVPVFLRYGYDGSKISIDYSTDGKIFERKGELELSEDIKYSQYNQFSFGTVRENSTYTCFPNAEFLWHKCYIKVNNEIIWGKAPSN